MIFRGGSAESPINTKTPKIEKNAFFLYFFGLKEHSRPRSQFERQQLFCSRLLNPGLDQPNSF